MKTITIKNQFGKEFDMDAVVHLMDNDIRDNLHSVWDTVIDQEFFDEYCKNHLELFGEEFEFNKLNLQV